MSAIRYILVWKDMEAATPRYFGPFATMAGAENFQHQLPRPMKGGCCDIRPIETGEQHFLPAIKETISSARRHRAYAAAHP